MEYEQLGFFEKSENVKREKFVANVFRQLGSTNHSDTDREDNDFYATEPLATVLLCEKEKFTQTVWEPCVGKGHIATVLSQQGYNVVCTDIIDRGYPKTEIRDFLSVQEQGGGGGEQKRHCYKPTIQARHNLCQKGTRHIGCRSKSGYVPQNTVFGVARAMGTVQGISHKNSICRNQTAKLCQGRCF